MKNEERKIKEETEHRNLYISEISIVENVESRGAFFPSLPLLLNGCIIRRIIMKQKSDNAASWVKIKLVTLTTPVVNLPTLVTLKLSWKVGGTGKLFHSFSLSYTKKSWTPLVFVSRHVTEDGKIRGKFFWPPICTK